jgi:hypothetical protein
MWLQILASRLQRRKWEREREREGGRFWHNGVAVRKLISKLGGRASFYMRESGETPLG